MAVRSFRELRVWEQSMDLVEEVYRMTRQFPTEELYGLSSQMRRAAVSVPSNIAEGHAREHIREYLHHMSVAQASLAELETQVEIACRLCYVTHDQRDRALDAAASLGRQLYALRNALRKKAQTDT